MKITTKDDRRRRIDRAGDHMPGQAQGSPGWIPALPLQVIRATMEWTVLDPACGPG